MNFLRQLFEITTRKNSMVEKLAKPHHKNIVTVRDDEYEKGESEDNFFDYIIGYNDVKKFLRMSIFTEEPVHILLIGPPASGKTMFIKSMMMKT
jgi:predicted ATPase with chaperone activity